MPYAFGSCDDEQETHFEEHILECDRCYEDLAALDRTRSLIERFILSEPTLLRRSRARRRRHRLLLVVAIAAGLAVAATVGYLVGATA